MSNTDKDFSFTKETVFKGYFQIDKYLINHRLNNGKLSSTISREVFERGSAIAVLMYDPAIDSIVMIEQFRAGALAAKIHPWLHEIVAGIIDAGETPEQVVHREVKEEAGCEIQDMFHILDFLSSPGGCSELVSLYCATVDSSTVAKFGGLENEGEDIRVYTISVDDALAELKKNNYNNSVTIIALQWLALNRDSLSTRFKGK